MLTRKEYEDKRMQLWIAINSVKNHQENDIDEIMDRFDSEFSWLCNEYFHHTWVNDWARWAVLDVSGSIWEYDSRPRIVGHSHIKTDRESDNCELVAVREKPKPQHPILIKRTNP